MDWREISPVGFESRLDHGSFTEGTTTPNKRFSIKKQFICIRRIGYSLVLRVCRSRKGFIIWRCAFAILILSLHSFESLMNSSRASSSFFPSSVMRRCRIDFFLLAQRLRVCLGCLLEQILLGL